VGSPDNLGAQVLPAEGFRPYLPNKTIACGLSGGLALLENRSQINRWASVYVGNNHVYTQPVTAVEEFRALVKGIVLK
jgi:hypothetical protein